MKPSLSAGLDQRAWWWLTILAALWVWSSLGQNTFDDNFITYRYAANLVDGQGLTYNAGELVWGTTAPGYAILLAGLRVLLPIEIVTIGSTLSLFAIVWIMKLVGLQLRLATATAASVAVLLLTSRFSQYLLGSEVFAATACAIFAFVLAARRKTAPAAAWATVGMAIRPDMALAVLAAALALARNANGRSGRFALLSVTGGALTWLALAQYFGEWVPNTLTGKTALADVLYVRVQWRALSQIFHPGGAAALLIIGTAGLILGARNKNEMARFLLLWAALNEIAYRVIGVWFAPWYHFPTLLALLAGAAILVQQWWRSKRLWLKAAAPALLVALSGPGFVDLLSRTDPHPRTLVYGQLARCLHGIVDSRQIVAAHEIGALGYYLERPILDLGGLVSREFAIAKMNRTRTDLLANLKPDFIVGGKSDQIITPVVEKSYVLLGTMQHPSFYPIMAFSKDLVSLTCQISPSAAEKGVRWSPAPRVSQAQPPAADQ